MTMPGDHSWNPDPQLLAAYFDGEMEGRNELAELRCRIETWLEHHPDALATGEEIRRLRQAWLDTTPAEPNAATWNDTLTRIEAARLRPIRPPVARRPWLMASACAVALVVATSALIGGLRYYSSPAIEHHPVAEAPRDPLAPVDEANNGEVLPVALAHEVVIFHVDGEDTAALVVGQLPLQGLLELADPGEIRVFSIQPDAQDRMVPDVRQDGPRRPVIWARLDTEED